MRPTIRGWTAAVVVAAAMLLGWRYGARALDAVVTPLLVVLAAGLVVVARTERPTVRRVPVADGAVGERRTVELAIESPSAVSATVRDAVGDGLAVLETDAAGTAAVDDGDPVVETTLDGDDRVAYEIRLEERGERRLGPVTITVSDVIGLVQRRFVYEETTTVLACPRVRELRAGPGRDLRAVADAVVGRDREAFDHLREYHRGDSLRDVHWKSAAKRPDADLVVTEYAADEETGAATIAADCAPGRADELATAVASVTVHLLEAGVDVGVALPDADREPGAGREHRRDLLAALARLEAGALERRRRENADVLIRADEDGTRLVLGDRTIPFERLVGDDGRSTDGRDGSAASAGDGGDATGPADRTTRDRTDRSDGSSEPGVVP